MELKTFAYGKAGELVLPFDKAVERVKEVLGKYGFGVQAEIQISEALKTKLGVDVPQELILGVCNPNLAYRAILVEPEITVLLPCNVTVRSTEKGVQIAFAAPGMLVGMTGNPKLKEVAAEAEERLNSAMAEL